MAQAGDPIILPSDQSKAPPAPQVLGTKEVLKPTERIPTVNPQHIEGLTPPTPSGRRKKTELDKRRQAAYDERRNWLLLRPGQLTDKTSEEHSFGVRLDKWANDEPDVDRRDYTFYELDRATPDGQRDSARAPARQPQTRQPTGQAQASAGRTEELEEKDRRKAGSGDSLLLFDQARPGQGAHTAKELDLRGYLDTTVVDFQSGSQGQVSLGGLLGGSGPAGRSREQQARLDEFKEFLNAPKGPALGGDLNPAAKRSADLGRPPTAPTRALPDIGLGLGNANPLAGPADLGGPDLSRSLPIPGLPDLNANRFSAPSRLPSAPPVREPMTAPPISRPSVLRPTVLEIPSTR